MNGAWWWNRRGRGQLRVATVVVLIYRVLESAKSRWRPYEPAPAAANVGVIQTGGGLERVL